jgi:transposase
MMRPSSSISEVYVCMEIVDFRKGMNSLAVLIEAELEYNPFSEKLFVFRNRNRKQIRIIYWEGNGFCMWQKRLDKETFKWPKKSEGMVQTITGQELNWLLDGYDISIIKPHKKYHYSAVY